MAQMVVRFRSGEHINWGLLQSPAPAQSDEVLTVRKLATQAQTTAALIEELKDGSASGQQGEEVTVRAGDLMSPVTESSRLLCQGLNYATHAGEAGHAERKANLFFMKASSSLSGAFDAVVKPDGTELLDFEVEIGIVLRRDLAAGAIVDSANIGEYVAGVTLCNDVSARDIMFGAGFFQWFQGKSYRTFCPTGPVLYLLDESEVADVLGNLDISLSLNGDLRQVANSRDWIFKPAETLTQVAEFMNLSQGDMILTGTPGGVLAQGTPALMEILRRDLLDDVKRRNEIRVELQKATRFLQAGDKLILTLLDGNSGTDLGGHNYSIS
jgi:2-keto-4-pentenoate hydratase/2-oxohepta-3-ene-1,7-dioic acid hydratase in catechol pathway